MYGLLGVAIVLIEVTSAAYGALGLAEPAWVVAGQGVTAYLAGGDLPVALLHTNRDRPRPSGVPTSPASSSARKNAGPVQYPPDLLAHDTP